MQKHKFAFVSLTMRDRAILSKVSIWRVSKQSTLANFVEVLEQNSCFPLGGHYACQCVLFLVYKLTVILNCGLVHPKSQHINTMNETWGSCWGLQQYFIINIHHSWPWTISAGQLPNLHPPPPHSCCRRFVQVKFQVGQKSEF